MCAWNVTATPKCGSSSISKLRIYYFFVIKIAETCEVHAAREKFLDVSRLFDELITRINEKLS